MPHQPHRVILFGRTINHAKALRKREQFGVIWDSDGVLANTAWAHFRSWAEALAWWNIPFDRETFDRVFGMKNRSNFSRNRLP